MTTHLTILRLLRERTAQDGNPLGFELLRMSDEEAWRFLFRNYRGNATIARGLRLSEFGLQLMRCYFKCYEMQVCGLAAKDILYLDKNATLPYYCDAKCIIMFEMLLGTKLKLVDGNIQTLLDME